MLRKIKLCLLILLLCANAYATDYTPMTIELGSAKVKDPTGRMQYIYNNPYADPGNTDIIFYLSCDSKTDAEISGGSATVNWDTNVLIDTTYEIVGTGCADQDNKAYSDFDFATSGNIDFESGRFGFWYYPKDNYVYEGGIVRTTGDDFRLQVDNTNESLELLYMGTENDDLVSDCVQDTWCWVEFYFAGATCYMYMDNNLITTVTGSGTPNDTSMSFMAQTGAAHDCFIDNIISTNDPDRVLYDFRYETDFS